MWLNHSKTFEFHVNWFDQRSFNGTLQMHSQRPEFIERSGVWTMIYSIMHMCVSIKFSYSWLPISSGNRVGAHGL